MKKILIFDAYPSIRQLLTEELAAEGHVTMSVSQAESLRESIEGFNPDLIILDLYARGEILWSLPGKLKNSYPAIPIILFTGFPARETSLMKQADAWVQKSSEFEDLKEKIKFLLEQEKEGLVFREPILGKDSNRIGLPGLSNPAASSRDH
jgi:DNA-binding response OmpR family regulator